MNKIYMMTISILINVDNHLEDLFVIRSYFRIYKFIT